MMLVIIDLLYDNRGVTRYMRSGSPAPDGSWPSAQRPYPDEATSGPAPQGPGPRNDPREGPGGRREVPFGPEISWPQGFRQLDSQSRDVLESSYGTGSVYQQPAIDDYGYGDPGYADPSYEGPKTRYPDSPFRGNTGSRTPAGPTASGWPGYAVPGYQVPDLRSQPQDFPAASAGPRDIYPVTGAQEALRDTGPQPPARGWAAQDSGGPAATGSSVYPEHWYGHPRPDDRALGDGVRNDRATDGSRPADGRPADPRPSDARPADLRPTDARPADPRPSDARPADTRPTDLRSADARSADLRPADLRPADSRSADPRPADPRSADGRSGDPRLVGMRYDELRYDEPSEEERPADRRGFGESFDDDSWLEDLRRSAPVYPQTPGDQPLPAGPAARAEAGAPGSGPQPGYPQRPATDWFTGRGPGRSEQANRGDRGGSAPQLSAGRADGAGSRPGGPSEPGNGFRPGIPAGAGAARQPGSTFPQGLTGQDSGFLGAPTARVGVLTPPAGSRVVARPESDPLANPFLAPPSEGRVTAPGRLATPVRPGHGLDGPEITSSWPAAPQVDEIESFAEFWREDDEDGDYAGLFGDRVVAPDGAGSAAKRRIGRRRSGSNDHRLWLALGGVVVVAAAAITGIIKFEFPSHGGPAHVMGTPASIGTFARTVDLERQTNVAQLRDEVIKMSAGQASRVVSAVYESGNSAAGNTEQIVMFIGGHLANAAPATSVSSFTQKFPGAEVVAAGSLGGKAACVEEGSSSDSVSMCAWFDNDSFGEIVSPTMNSGALAKEMLTVRSAVETVVKK
jgi:hypothetical protein